MATHSPFTFQEVIMRLERYWADQGCLIWQPYSEKLGAGTGNPATTLRVLGPEPWNVGYVEPSYRPDDGRFAENPNRMQMHTQYQVILKPDPGNPQELYLNSLRAIGVDLDAHDVRFVEDNWESPALGAWGLGWEVWLDGLEITQYTYFQQAGGLDLDPVAVELTYGLERIVMFLQGVEEVWDLQWDDRHTYGDVYKLPEIEHCEYAFNAAGVERLQRLYDLYEAEFQDAIAHGLVIPAYDYVLRCSHTFNLLDTRGAVGVTERANYFRRMRNMSRQVAEAYVAQRQRMEYPFLEEVRGAEVRSQRSEAGESEVGAVQEADLLLEIGAEELPVGDLLDAIAQLEQAVPAALAEARLDHGAVSVTGTPRRVVVYVERLAPRQRAQDQAFRGPPADRAFDADGHATQAAVGFARSKGLSVSDLEVREEGGRRYVYAIQRVEGEPTSLLLPDLLRGWVAGLRFAKSMRWNSSNASFSRPLRWLVALYGDQLVPFEYANVASGRVSRGLRPQGSPELAIPRAGDYLAVTADAGIVVDRAQRRRQVAQGIQQVAATVGGQVPADDALLDEVTDLVEQPLPLLGRFDPQFLQLPTPVLITVMKKHQRYFPVVRGSEYQKSEYQKSEYQKSEGQRSQVRASEVRGSEGQRSEVRGSRDDQMSDPLTSDILTSDILLPYFITVANGADRDAALVTRGNEAVIRARYADAAYFVREDRKKPLEAFNAGLATLTFQEQLGSMLDKVRRLEMLVPVVAGRLGLSQEETAAAVRAALLSKADLATDMVVEMTSLQGVMGEIYALDSGEAPEVARAVREHYVVRPEDGPLSPPGLALNLSNRLDSLSGLFSVGLAPTSSADPFGLRRDALALVENLMAAGRSFDVAAGLRAAGDLQPVPVDDEVIAETAAFVARRLYGVLRDQGYAHDVVEAVLAQQGHDPARAAEAVAALAQVVADPAWMDVLTAYARCKRIVRALDVRYSLAPERYVEQASRDLQAAYEAVASQVAESGDVAVLYEALGALVDPINRFFDGVLVMTEDPALREARLALVQHVAALPDGIVDLSLMQGF